MIRPPRPFVFETDRFAFANESRWTEDDGASVYENGGTNGSNGSRRRIYRKRCYVMARSAVQFWKFARFDREADPVGADELVDRILAVRGTAARLPVRPAADRVAFPGFDGLHAFSREHARLLRRHLGAVWSTYLRPGNLRMAVPPTRRRQRVLRDALVHALDHHTAVPLWLFTFPNFLMTHSVVAYRYTTRRDGSTVFTVYDPNYRSHPKRLTFRAHLDRFHYQRTYFFKGGKIDVASIYPIAPGATGQGARSASGVLTV
jgi:hypothetical protein